VQWVDVRGLGASRAENRGGQKEKGVKGEKTKGRLFRVGGTRKQKRKSVYEGN